MNDRVFELNGVSRSFGQVKAVENLTLSLGKGEVTGFLGTNGAGKTTTIKMLIGLIRPTSGTVSLFGGDPSDAATRARLVAIYTKGKTLAPDVTPEILVAAFDGLSCAAIETVLNQAQALCQMSGSPAIGMEHILSAAQKTGARLNVRKK